MTPPPEKAEGAGDDERDASVLIPRWVTYVQALGSPVGAISAALVVGFVGFLGQKVLESERNARVYIELMNQRAQAESAMRMAMFESTLSRVLQSDSASVDNQLLRLELLALNFSEALSLSPLFREMDRTIREVEEGTEQGATAGELLGRLESLAKRVNGWQLARLEVEGDHRQFEKPAQWMWGPLGGLTERFELELGGVAREYVISLSNPNIARKTVDVRIQILTKNPQSSTDARLATRSFTLGYYDFPLIDNTRLSNDQRFALVLVDFDQNIPDCFSPVLSDCAVATLEAVVFPGSIATQREAPTLEAMIDNLAERQRQ